MSSNCPTDASKSSDYTLLAFAISLFPPLLPLEFPRHRKSLSRLITDFKKTSEMALAIFRDTVANPSCLAGKDIFLLKFRHRKSL